MSRNSTIVDVAQEAGVSYSTVSRVINNPDQVKPDKRERVLKAMAKLAFTINPQARSLRGGRSYTVGLVVRDLGTGYVGEVVRGIDLTLAEAEYELMLHTTHRRKTREAAYVATLTRGMADGLLLLLPRFPEAYLESLSQRRFPYVLIDHQGITDTGPAIGATNRQGAYAATQYLIELGHRRIGFITGALEMGCAVDRLDGYQAALADHGVEDDPALIQTGDFFQPQGYAGAQALMALPQPPTAIFASNDVMAFGVMEAIRELGLHIPEDVSVVGFDDIPQAAQVNPLLTTVRQPLEAMGRMAAQMLLDRIANPDLPAQRVDLPTELIVRASTRRPR